MRNLIVLYLLVFANLYGWDAVQSAVNVASQINDPKTVIVDVSDLDVYHTDGHIHGAVHTDISAWRTPHEKFLLLKSPDEIQVNIRSLGINTNSNIILYGHLTAPKELLRCSYIYWAMKSHGVQNVAIMEGGLEQWKAEKRFVAHDDPRSVDGNFTVKLIPNSIVDLSYVKQNIGQIAMIDGRMSENYFGVVPSIGVERLGHIMQSMSYPWMYSVGSDLKVKSAEGLRKIFGDGFDLRPSQEILLYCTDGLESSFNYFVMSGILGYTNVRLYDGSMREWGNRQDTPMIQYKWETFHPLVEVIK